MDGITQAHGNQRIHINHQKMTLMLENLRSSAKLVVQMELVMQQPMAQHQLPLQLKELLPLLLLPKELPLQQLQEMLLTEQTPQLALMIKIVFQFQQATLLTHLVMPLLVLPQLRLLQLKVKLLPY
jgi:hypothetical protein